MSRLKLLSTFVKPCEDLNRRAFKIIAINGGDGTITRTITAILQEYGNEAPLPKIVLLKGGTVNMLAMNLGIFGRPEALLGKLMLSHSSGKTKKYVALDTLEVDGNYGFLFANGAASAFLKKFYQDKTNIFGAILLFIKILLSRVFDPALYRSIIKEHAVTVSPLGASSFSLKSVGIFAATVRRLPLGIKLFPNVGTGSGLMQCVFVTTTQKNSIWRIPITGILRPGKSDADKFSLSCKQIELSSNSMENYTLDGELFDTISGKVQIQIGPRIEFLIP